MNRKLSSEDRAEIRRRLRGGETHASIAEDMGVSVKTIDREAVHWKAHTVTVRAQYINGEPVLSSVHVGKALQGADVFEAVKEAEDLVRELAAAPIPELSEDELSRICRELEAMSGDLGGGHEAGRSSGIVAEAEAAIASMIQSAGRSRQAALCIGKDIFGPPSARDK